MTKDPEARIRALRDQIDKIDEQLQRLIEQRARCALDIAEAKRSGDGDGACYRPEREAQILRRIMERNQGPIPDAEVARLFREIMSACLALESALTVAYLGPEGTFSQAAALKHFGHSAHGLACTTIDEVFREVEAGNANFGVVPAENSTEGMVSHTLDCLLATPLKICGEVVYRIQHHLMAQSADWGAIEQVVSHEQSLGQCRKWLGAHLPAVTVSAAASNAEAARMAAGDPKVAAIAGGMAAEAYGLKVLAEGIEDHPGNTTRFVVIGTIETRPSGRDKTSLVVSGKNRPGTLHTLLAPLARHDISMTRIESRPTRQALWEYVFFIDVEGHAQDPTLGTAIAELEKEAAFLKQLGSYPAAVNREK